MDQIRLSREKLQEVILPIFITTKGDAPDVIDFLGTGFIIAPNLFITCWHCVDVNISNDHQIAAINVKEDGSDHKVIPLVNIEQDSNSTDLSIANHIYEPSEYLLKLSTQDVPFGSEVWTYGYPLSAPKLTEKGSKQFLVPPQFFKSYIIRNLAYEHSEYGVVPSYEIDLNIPLGLSGAPLMVMGTRIVIGVIYGSNDIARIEEFSETDSATEKKTTEVQRIVSYGLAHYTSTLLNLKGTATTNKSLAEFDKGFR